MVDWSTVLATVLLLLLFAPLEYALLFWWLSRKLLSERNVTALSDKVAPVIEKRLSGALPALREGLRAEFLAGLKHPALRETLRAEVVSALASVPEWVEKEGPKMAKTLGTVLDQWAASKEGQEALAGLLDGAVARIGPLVEGFFSGPQGQAMVEKLAVRIRQEALRWWGSQKGGAARKVLRTVVPKGTSITGIPALDEKIGPFLSNFIGGKLEGMFGSMLGVQDAEFSVVGGSPPALPPGGDGLTDAERALLEGS